LVLTGKGEKWRGQTLPGDFPEGTRVHNDLSAFADWLLEQLESPTKAVGKAASKTGALS
jgi:D-glycero-D-manno-heptose 1,7-bisphosphate phosphatase